MNNHYRILSFEVRVVFSILAIVLFISANTMADTKVWTGGGENANISNPANWSGGTAPAGGDAWEFGAVGSSGYNITNDYGAGTFNSGITFTEAATGSYTISPNWTCQTGDIVNYSSYPQYVSLGHELHNSITINAANGDITLSQNNTINLHGNNLTIDGGHNTTISLYISSNGSIVKNGAGTLELYNSSYTGDVTINSGTLIARGQSIGDPGAQKTVLINKGASIELASHDIWGQASYRSPALIIVDGGTIYNSVPSDGVNGWFNTLNYLTLKNGGNIIDNSGHFEWLSYQLVGECNVIADSKLEPNQISTISIGNVGDNNGVIPNGVNFNVADVTQDKSTDLLISARLRNGKYAVGNFTKTGAGTMELTAVNDMTGAITISEGTLKLSGSGTLGSGAVTNNAALEFAYETDETVDKLISGTGEVIKSGSGALLLNNSNNSYTGNVTINEGTFKAIVGSFGNKEVDKTITVNKGATIEFSSHDVFGIDSARSPVNIIVDGGAICNAPGWFNTLNLLTLKNGGKIIDNTGHNGWLSFQLVGECNVTADAPLAADQISTIAIGTEGEFNGISPNKVKFNVADVTGNNSTDLLVSARLRNAYVQGGGSFTKSGAGTMELTNFNDISGAVTISEGTLKLSGNGTLGYGSVTNNATLEFAYDSDQTTVDNAISGTGKLIKSGTGALTLTNISGFTGSTTVKSGALNLTSAQTLFNLSGGSLNDDGTVAVTAAVDASGQALTLSNSETSQFIGTIKAQSMTKSGSGVLQLFASDSNSPITVSESFVVNAGELDFKGYFEGNIEVINGAVFSPGNSVGEANIAGNISFTSAAASSNGVALFEFGEYTGEDVNHDTFVLGSDNLFIADDGVIRLLFESEDSAAQWATKDKEYKLVTNGGFSNDDYSTWLSNYTDWFKLTGKDDGLYLVGQRSAPEPGSGVPEPSTWALLILGSAGLLYMKKRK
ncbi:MAG: autotransporter-associated beta strand repeat-containing protein [Thermoguttaceae bacterium]|nr:autotransporter-associated beta strand repeat-containing protein [Thermoguttaceae bacterium]